MKKYFLVFLSVLLISLIPSCTKDKIDENVYDIEYKLEGSDGVKITTIQYNTDDAGATETINVPEEGEANFFESETYRLKQRNAYILVYATGPNSSSTLKAQIFKNGVLAKEYIRTGTALGLELGLP
jgi:hypothetical protein